MEAARVRFPVGGFEWGLVGYTLAPYPWARGAAQWVGASGWSVVLVAVAAGLVVCSKRSELRIDLVGPLAASLLLIACGALWPAIPDGPPIRVAIVQGSTPCPLTHCFDERRTTYEMHLSLTRSIPRGSVDLVVWPEGSTGGFDADPVLNPDVAAAIGAEAARIGAYLLAGGDRPISDEHWINANVVFGPDGRIVGEYRKRHPVPFGEYIPARPLFEWIPALAQVPRDMIPGRGSGDLRSGRRADRFCDLFRGCLWALRPRRSEPWRSAARGGHQRGKLRIHAGIGPIHRHDSHAFVRTRSGGRPFGCYGQVDLHHPAARSGRWPISWRRR